MYLYNIDMLRERAFTYLPLCSLINPLLRVSIVYLWFAAPFLHVRFDYSLLRCIIMIRRDKMPGKSTLTRAVWIGYKSFKSIYFGWLGLRSTIGLLVNYNWARNAWSPFDIRCQVQSLHANARWRMAGDAWFNAACGLSCPMTSPITRCQRSLSDRRRRRRPFDWRWQRPIDNYLG